MNQLWSSYYNKAIDNLKENKLNSALNNLQFAENYHKNYYIYNLMGLCYFRKGILFKSINCFKKSLEIEDNIDGKTYLNSIEKNINYIKETWNSINTYLESKKYKMALELAIGEKFKSLLQETEYYNAFVGLIYYRCNKKSCGKTYWKKAYKINTENTDVLKYIYEIKSVKDILMKKIIKDRSLI